MKLLKVQVRLFRNILDSGEVEIHDEVTCLVGKNESGKTAFLHALYRLNPAQTDAGFDVHEQYPAWLEKRHRLEGTDLDEIRPIRAVFALEDDDREALKEQFGPGAVTSDVVTVERTYGGEKIYHFETDEQAAVRYVIEKTDFPQGIRERVRATESFQALRQLIEELRAQEGDAPESAQAAEGLQSSLSTVLGDMEFEEAVRSAIVRRIPAFFYFDKYSELHGTENIRKILESDDKNLEPHERTARSLLRLGATDEDYLLNPNYELRKRELENVANALTHEVLDYWSQNPELRVYIDITQRTVTNAQGQTQSILDELKIRIWDERHWLSLPFDEHSSGFRWFFSFLAAFSELQREDTPVVILLDEPALGLHARAQKDFLRFIDERLASKHQVIHTTHSPFMVQPDRLERVRLVEDTGREEGAKVSQDILTTDPDTLFPLQGALGYDIAQHLLIAAHNLVVEGVSDYTYLIVLSDYLKEQGRIHLDGRWSVVPVGGADLIPTFVALLGMHLDVTVLVDARKGGNQKLTKLAEEGYLSHKRLITVGQVLGRKQADIEDVFTVDDYLSLYNLAFGKSLQPGDLTGTDPLVYRIARKEGVDRFDHGRPADILLRHRDELLPKLSEDTLSRFEGLFERINATLPEPSNAH